MIKNCLKCNKEFKVRPYRINVAKFCSRSCSVSYRKNYHINICKTCGISFTKPNNPQKEYKFCSVECRAKKQIKAKKEILCLQCKKIFNPSRNNNIQKFCSKDCSIFYYDKGKTKENKKIRTSLAYQNWRKSIFERDNYTCQECKIIGGKLNADHIKPFALFPNLRLDINNGRTLCEECHRKTDTWGRTGIFRNLIALSQEA